MAYISYITGSVSMAIFLVLSLRFNIPTWVIACLWFVIGWLCMDISERVNERKMKEVKEMVNLEKEVKRLNQAALSWREKHGNQL